VAESEGSFGLDDWEVVFEEGKRLCCGGFETADGTMQSEEAEETGGMMAFVKSALQEKVAADLHWKG